MKKIRKLKLIALLFLVAGLAMYAHAPSVAADSSSYSQSDQDAVLKRCAQELKISQSSKDKEDKKVLGACEEGYFIGIDHPTNSSPCDNPYKGDSKALHACKQVGFPLGQTNPLKIKPKTTKTGKAPATPACSGSTCDATPTGSGQNCDSDHCDLVNLYVNPAIRLLSLLVGLIIAASLVMGGVQYASAGSDPQKVSAAKSRISNTLMAFFAYAFMYAFLNFLIPGGVFK